MNTQSAIDFPGTARIPIALAVSDLDRSRVFYETLLGIAPTKVRADYAKFEPQDPSVNLTLNLVTDHAQLAKPATHYGVQVKSTDAVRDAITRLGNAGPTTDVEENTTCCYAVQDKVWVTDPDGNQWEVFVVTEADANQRKDEASTCCAVTPAGASATPSASTESCC